MLSFHVYIHFIDVSAHLKRRSLYFKMFSPTHVNSIITDGLFSHGDIEISKNRIVFSTDLVGEFE